MTTDTKAQTTVDNDVDNDNDNDVDVVVVGAGPAGSAAAISVARAGFSVILLERGPFPGSKNMYGGVVYGRVLDGLIPHWWDEAPIQRWVTRRGTMMMTETQSLTIDYRTDAWGEKPYNGATAYRPDFDQWLASHAVNAGAELLSSTTATGLIRDGSRIVGVTTDRPGGDIRAKVVVAADGVNSFLAKEAGLYHHNEPEHFTVGVKETVTLGRDAINERFGLVGNQGADFEIIGCTQGIPGGGFIYTNLDTVSVGVVLQLSELAHGSNRPEQIIANMKEHSSIAPLLRGGEVSEYSAHVIPEGGFNMMPQLYCDGLMVTGDAAAMCLAAGIWLEGVNFAIGSGIAAGQTAVEAMRLNDHSEHVLARYKKRMDTNFVLQDHRKLRDVPELIMSDRVQQHYPEIACNLAEAMFTVTNPRPKAGVRTVLQQELQRSSVSLKDIVRDGLSAMKGYG